MSAKKQPINKSLLVLIPVIIGLALVAYFIFQKQTVPEKLTGPYDQFAQCLYDQGLRMYGSQTCSFCARQRKLFQGSADYIQEIECDPRNPDNQAELCIEKNVSHTPTWLMEDADGNEIKRFEPGVVSLEELSEVSGCPLEAEPENE